MKEDCKYDKFLFIKFIVIASIFGLFFLFLNKIDEIEKQRTKKLIDLFNNNQRIVCQTRSKQRFISKKLGFKVNKNKTKFINDIELFDIGLCHKENKDVM